MASRRSSSVCVEKWLDAQRLWDIGSLESALGAVANVQHFDVLLLFEHTVNRALNVWLVAVQQVPELVAFWCHRAMVRRLFEAEYRFL